MKMFDTISAELLVMLTMVEIIDFPTRNEKLRVAYVLPVAKCRNHIANLSGAEIGSRILVLIND